MNQISKGNGKDYTALFKRNRKSEHGGAVAIRRKMKLVGYEYE